MKTTSIICGYCGMSSDKQASEITRRMKEGRTVFFCNNACSTNYQHRQAGTEVLSIVRICANVNCGKEFPATTGRDATYYCSRACANRREHSPETLAKLSIAGKASRNHKHNFGLDTTALGLRNREWHKYCLLDTKLTELGIEHYFEFALVDYIYDLFIPLIYTMFEFDGSYHNTFREKDNDRLKDLLAQQHCCKIVRISEPPSPFSPDLLDNYIEPLLTR